MTNESALIIMQGVVDHYSMDVAQREAWQTLKSAVLAQRSDNSASMQCEMCKYENEAADMWPCSDCCHCMGDHFTQRTQRGRYTQYFGLIVHNGYIPKTIECYQF